VTLLSSKAYKWLQVPLFILTVNVGNDKWLQVPPFNLTVNVVNDNYSVKELTAYCNEEIP